MLRLNDSLLSQKENKNKGIAYPSFIYWKLSIPQIGFPKSLVKQQLSQHDTAHKDRYSFEAHGQRHSLAAGQVETASSKEEQIKNGAALKTLGQNINKNLPPDNW